MESLKSSKSQGFLTSVPPYLLSLQDPTVPQGSGTVAAGKHTLEISEVFFKHQERAPRGDLMELKMIPPNIQSMPVQAQLPSTPQPKQESESCPSHHEDKNETTFKINIYFY